ncbi:hypothetical protein HAPAU_21630 [Halalkalicoccus paucihalophilus]|uniref:Uncharacterized protein n=1 Tax=Halalkalicoccus paucihalophilus TaxID=1008153 RepID=A0A151ACS4_9EURY|nr:hypothetical protein [Halalkalicoccus paucihalophilus]KYH25491.1 hypothetical protein HAPAU_21630 [Halalkalicoccus paucihalophilus]
MERLGAAAGGLAFAVLILGGFVAIRLLTRLFYSVVLLVETLSIAAFALLIGYVVYRILLGSSDNPRRSH